MGGNLPVETGKDSTPFVLKVKEYFRTKKVENCFVSLQDCEELPAENASTTHISEDEFEEILNTVQKKILSLLNDDERQIFIKLYIEKKTVKIVSDEMGITENNVYVKSHRTKKKVKKIISNMDLLVNVIFFKLFM